MTKSLDRAVLISVFTSCSATQAVARRFELGLYLQIQPLRSKSATQQSTALSHHCKSFNQKRSRAVPGKEAFTLIELLVVLAILAVLSSLVVPTVSSVTESNNMKRSTQLLIDQIHLARQLASAGNRTIEVRLIKTGNAKSGYDAVQLFKAVVSSGTAMTPCQRMVTFPSSTVVSANHEVSQLLNALGAEKTMTKSGSGSGSYNYVSFQIKPSGMVIPNVTMRTCFLSVVPERYGEAAGLPANYSSIQVNPITGTPLLYQP